MNIRKCEDWLTYQRELQCYLSHGHTYKYSIENSYNDINVHYKTHWNNMYDLLGFIKQNYTGINTPEQYYSTQGSAFGIHVDPYNLGTLNLNLIGSSKLWLFVKPTNRDLILNYLK